MPSALFEHAIDLFNRGQYFECHESLEELWLRAANPQKRFLQGLIQMAVALHHYRRGNLRGALSLLERSRLKLTDLPHDFGGLDLPSLQCAIENWLSALVSGGAVPDFPVLTLDRKRMIESLFS